MCHFQAKSALTYFQTPTHEISLFASLNTLNDFFLYKTQKQPIMSFPANFNCFQLLVRLFPIGLKKVLKLDYFRAKFVNFGM